MCCANSNLGQITLCTYLCLAHLKLDGVICVYYSHRDVVDDDIGH